MRRSKATASEDIVNLLLKYSAGIGVNSAGIGKAPQSGDCETLKTIKKRISIEQLNAIWNQVSLQAGDPDFGLHFGEKSHHFLGGNILLSVMMNCANLGNAMEKLARYHGLTTDFILLQLSHQNDYTCYSLNTVYPEFSLDRQYSEAILCGLALMLQRLSEGKLQLVEVRFNHPQPPDITEHQRIFGCPLRFEQPRYELVIKSAALSLPIFQANPELLLKLEQFAAELLNRLYTRDTWSDRVACLLGGMLRHGEKPTINTVARELTISPRHLQNKLKEESTTYQTILDQLRKEMAFEYLKKPDVTFYDIAFLLGFSDQSVFNHAFKRWTGVSPGEYKGPS